jgi:hypothetical protein
VRPMVVRRATTTRSWSCDQRSHCDRPTVALRPTPGRTATGPGSHCDRPKVALRPTQGRTATGPGSHCDRPRVALRPAQGRTATDPGSHCDRPRVALRPTQGRTATDPGSHCDRPRVALRPTQGHTATDPGSHCDRPGVARRPTRGLGFRDHGFAVVCFFEPKRTRQFAQSYARKSKPMNPPRPGNHCYACKSSHATNAQPPNPLANFSKPSAENLIGRRLFPGLNG